MGMCVDIGTSAFAMPAMAAEIFSHGRILQYEPAMAPGSNGLANRAMTFRGGIFGPSTGVSSQGVSLFGTYLTSALEVLREFTIRLQCLVMTPQRRCSDALL